MIKFILGAKGVGKTRWLIENANEDMAQGNGNIAFVEVDDDHIFSLDYNIRLINATEYNLNDLESFYGFICGLCAMDYDLRGIYVDGIYKVLNLSITDLEYLHKKLESVKDAASREIYINVDYLQSDMSDYLKENSIEITSDEVK